MSTITHIDAIEILDSRANPTLQVTVACKNHTATASVPSGASVGSKEAFELRDGDKKRYFGKGVLKAKENVKGPIFHLLKSKDVLDQSHIDQLLIEEDGTPNKSKLGANAILGVSLACAKLKAKIENKPLYRSICTQKHYLLPCPMMNIINGGAHADNAIDFQEFMIRPVGAKTFSQAIQMGVEVFHTLKNLLKKKSYVTAVGDEGGFAPRLRSNEEALDLICLAIEQTPYSLGKEITLALDCAASEFYDKKTHRYLDKDSEAHIDYLEKLSRNYPIDSIEDGLDENDWEGWQLLTKRLSKLQIVGDDIFVTNPQLLQEGIDQNVANAVLIKPNQIGTLTQTLQAIDLAHQNQYKTIISHRSGETEDTFIADLAVAKNCLQIKTGSLCRTDRTCKYNRLLTIEHNLKS
ncbi:MAG: Enolase [Chlamydiae bacterium]|nr:Enolase [Chlamydiota bacterium]